MPKLYSSDYRMYATSRPLGMPTPACKTTPRVWLVIGDKLGDNAQVDIIAEALGWPCERKQLAFREPYIVGKPPFKPSLYHLDRARSTPLDPPWPELIITVGRRPSMAAMWVREQSRRRTKIVLIGRPKKMLDQFDLVIATAQYRLPSRPNVLHLDFPLMRGNEAAIAKAISLWKPRLQALPRPLLALFVGGPTKPFAFDAKVAAALIEKAVRCAGEAGGTLYATTSRRTPPVVVEALEAGLPPGSPLYRWEAGGADNPYLALLGLADCFIVTGDSVSMMVEVARLGKPLAIFPLPCRLGLAAHLRQLVGARLQPPAGSTGGGFLPFLGDILHRLGFIGYSRDLTALHRLLIGRGMAVSLGDRIQIPEQKLPDELPGVVERIRALMGPV